MSRRLSLRTIAALAAIQRTADRVGEMRSVVQRGPGVHDFLWSPAVERAQICSSGYGRGHGAAAFREVWQREAAAGTRLLVHPSLSCT